MPYRYKLMARADDAAGEVLEEGELPGAGDRRHAQDLAVDAYRTARFKTATSQPPTGFPRAVIVLEDGAEVWRAGEADLPDAEHDMDC